MDGVININKPQGLTSHDVVLQARRITGEKRIGHTGTLDPLATGVLVLCLGSQRVLQWRYRRRLSRLPGFTRMRTESALARSNGMPLRETSTIDSPAPSRASK